MSLENLVVNGVEFKSKEELLIFLGVDEVTFDWLIDKGLTVEEAANEVMVKLRNFRINRNYVWEGKKYSNLNEIADAIGVPETTIRNRFIRGVDLESLFLRRHSKTQTRFFEFNGIAYRNLTSFIQSCGLDVIATAGLIKDKGYAIGYVYKKHLMEKLKSDYGKQLFPDGYEEMKVYAEMNNLQLNHVEMNFIMNAPLHLRFNTLDIYDYHGIELAKQIGYIKEDEYIHSAKHVSEEFGVPLYDLKKGLKQGLSVTDILVDGKRAEKRPPQRARKVFVPKDDHDFTMRQVTFNGKRYPNYGLLALEYGIGLQELKRRLEKGRTLSEALGVLED